MLNRKEATEIVEAIAGRGALVGGGRIATTSEGTFPHHDPATGEHHADVALSGTAEVGEAVAPARAAIPAWRGMAMEKRIRVLHRLADLVVERREECNAINALDNGSPVAILDSATYTAQFIRYYAGWIDKLDGRTVPVYAANAFDFVVPEPWGVIGAIPPWNGPMMGMAQKAVAAPAAGNTVVAKPPEIAPFGAVRLAELALEAGLPPGALNVTPGGAAAGDAMVRHPGVDKVSFTGGTGTARQIMATAAETLKPLALELGGKTANIIFPDADIDAASGGAAFLGACLFSGQGCARSEGAGRILTGGRPVALDGPLRGGWFIAPTAFGDVDHESSLAREEIFGPVLSVMRFSSEEEIVAKANDSPYGLSAMVHTRDLGRAHRMIRNLHSGTVIVNTYAAGTPTAPFGGYKQSGFGREGGRAGIDEFLQLKNVIIGE